MVDEIVNMTFEQAISKLENIVKELENENIALEESLEKFELGVKLSSFCLAKLNDAEKKIEELSRDSEGNLVTKKLNLEE